VCGLSVLLAYCTTNETLPGMIYVALSPLLALNGWLHGRQVRALTAHSPA